MPSNEQLRRIIPEGYIPHPILETNSFEFSWDPNEGKLINAKTGEDATDIAETYSLMKFGDSESIKTFAVKLEEAALSDPQFLEFLESTRDEVGDIILTSPGTSNVPKSSSLLAQEFAKHLNVFTTQNGLQPVVRDHPVPLTWREYVESKFTHLRPLASLTPGKFAGHPVVFVSELQTSKEMTEWVDHNIRTVGGATKVYHLFAAKIHPDWIKESGDSAINYIATRQIDGSLPSIKGIISHPNNEIVQRVVRTIMKPEHAPFLPGFLDSVPDEAVIKLYLAFSQTDFRIRQEDGYAQSYENIRRNLRSRGWIDEAGRMFRQRMAAEIQRTNGTEVKRLVTYTLNSKRDIPYEDAKLYSRMKYSDPEATQIIAGKMATTILENPTVQELIQNKQKIILSASAYGSVPTAAAIITQRVYDEFVAQGIDVELIRIHRKGQFSITNFGAMSVTEREQTMKQRQLWISDEDRAKLSEGNIIVIDDLSATGSHERALKDILATTDAKNVMFSYFIKFGERLMVDEPDIEEYLNRAQIKTVKDLLKVWLHQNFNENEGVFDINARTVKFFLELYPENEKDTVTFEQKKSFLKQALDQIPSPILTAIYKAASEADGYGLDPKFAPGFALVEYEMLKRNLVDVKEINRFHTRTAIYNITVDENGVFRDMETDEDRSDIVRQYSRMKFGSVRDIEGFSRDIANHVMSRISDPQDPLRILLEQTKAAGEHMIAFGPGYRNVESASNIILRHAIEDINIELALQGLPTIIMQKLPRLASNQANYASLSEAERLNLPPITDHILPGKELYQFGMHILFGDDVRITGTTADGVEKSARRNGAKSFSSIYAIQIDPLIAITNPEIENIVNTFEVKGQLDEVIEDILNQENFRPVQRLLRLVFQKENRTQLYEFLRTKINVVGLRRLYVSALNNDYLNDKRYEESITILQQVLIEKEVLDERGRLYPRNSGL